jgi:hypothetical protein
MKAGLGALGIACLTAGVLLVFSLASDRCEASVFPDDCSDGARGALIFACLGTMAVFPASALLILSSGAGRGRDWRTLLTGGLVLAVAASLVLAWSALVLTLLWLLGIYGQHDPAPGWLGPTCLIAIPFALVGSGWVIPRIEREEGASHLMRWAIAVSLAWAAVMLTFLGWWGLRGRLIVHPLPGRGQARRGLLIRVETRADAVRPSFRRA